MPITDKAMWINERHISTRGTGSAEVHCKQNKNRIQNKIDCKCSETRSKHTQKLKKDADFKILQPFQHHKLKRISRRLLFLICCHLPVLWKKWVCLENVHTCFMLRLTVFVVVVAVLPGTELSDALPTRGRAVGPP